MKIICPYCGRSEEKSTGWMLFHDRRTMMCSGCGRLMFQAVRLRLTTAQLVLSVAAVLTAILGNGVAKEAGIGTGPRVAGVLAVIILGMLLFEALARLLTRDSVLKKITSSQREREIQHGKNRRTRV